jgi:hypothetical protein
MTDQELKDLVASLAIAQAKTDAQMAKTDAQMAKTDAQMAKTDAQMAKTDAQMAKTDAKLDKLTALCGGIASNQGSVAEEFFFNSLVSKPFLGDIKFDRITPQLVVGRKGKQSEYDIVMVNGANVGIVEVKYKAHINDLEQVHAQIARFKRDCPEFKHYVIYGGIAALSVPKDVSKAAKAQGLFVLKRKGEQLNIQTDGMKGF